MTEKTFLSKDGKSTIHYYIWEPEVEPVAILQLVHGMAEHVTRYEPLARYLNSYGVLVCGHDHIGHGNSAKPEDWGYMGEENGWKIMVQDVEQLHGIMKVQYMDTPYFILGHSMGSFITRAWLAMYGNGVDGAIIMGTAGTNPALGAAKFLCKTIRKSKGSRHLSKLITNAAFGSYNKRIKPQRTPYDWLTRDESIVDRYIEDPACGFTFTVAGYADLFNVIGYVSDDKWYRHVPKELPMLLVAGREDPVGAYGAGPAEVAEKLQDAGCSDVSLILYDDMRHEILNEFGKETVMEDIRRFVLGEEAAGAEEEPEEAPAEAPAEALEEPEEASAELPAESEEAPAETLAEAAEAPLPAPEPVDAPAEEPVAVTVEETVAEVKEAAEEVREKAEKAAEEVKEKAEEAAAEVKEKVEEAAVEVKEKVEAAAEAAKDKAEKVAEAVKERVEETFDAAKGKAKEALGTVKEAAANVESASRQLADEAGKAAEEARWQQSEKSFSQVIKAAEAIGPEAKEAHSQAEAVLAESAAAAEKAAEKAAETVKKTAEKTKATADDVWVDLSRRDTLTAEALGRKIAAELAAKAEDGKTE